MESSDAKFPQNPPLKTEKLVHLTQICLRILAIGTALAATSVMATSKQTTVIFGTVFSARYSYSSAFKFFAFANAFASAFTLLSLFYVLLFGRPGSNPANYFILFIHDLFMASLVLAGCAAATAVGYIGRYGNNHIGWIAICDQFGKFCNRVTGSVILSYVAFLFLLILTVISASRSRKIQV
ncbi:CASP-like protein [Melia azedarach]|uniref:CASP-like protein n=1 Tax=Melia azedarach TaxID=155640 RepID=A0ACC1YYY1_MELAZ|nr:CASP-like protein [Melia azedarach]